MSNEVGWWWSWKRKFLVVCGSKIWFEKKCTKHAHKHSLLKEKHWVKQRHCHFLHRIKLILFCDLCVLLWSLKVSVLSSCVVNFHQTHVYHRTLNLARTAIGGSLNTQKTPNESSLRHGAYNLEKSLWEGFNFEKGTSPSHKRLCSQAKSPRPSATFFLSDKPIRRSCRHCSILKSLVSVGNFKTKNVEV